MKILSDNKKLDIPIWITVKDNILNVNLQTAKVNDRHGEAQIGGLHCGVRVLNCTGIIPTKNISEVEREKSRLTALLSDKELKVYRDEDDNIFYKCFLMGNIKIDYFNGKNIGRCFGISFSLKATEPFGYGEEKAELFIAKGQTVTIHNDGNYFCLPQIEIYNTPYVEGNILECGSSFLEVNKKVLIKTNEKLLYKNGWLFLNEKEISNMLTNRSFINPITFGAGDNTLKIKIKSGNIKITFNERFK